MKLTSTAFRNGGALPEKNSAYGENLSPPLHWTDVPIGTKSFALVCQDSDAPNGTFTHWVVYNMAADLRSLEEGVLLKQVDSIRLGTNDAGKQSYFGPKPPKDEMHHYHFRLFALKEELKLPSGLTGGELLARIGPKILAESDLTVLYGH